jgi:hypothetical protein
MEQAILKRKSILGYLLIAACSVAAQPKGDSAQRAPVPELKLSLNANGTHYFKITFMNQAWIRFNESNEGTTQFGKDAPTTFDIGLRRTRIQMFGQVTDRAFVYFQFGQNNFNGVYTNSAGNRKIAAFFHDALCEFKASKGDQLKIGGGLTVVNGVSRFSQPSVSSIMTLDVPVFLQYSVDQVDQFDRRLALYARGQLGKKGQLDYRIYIANPFPVSSNGSTTPAITKSAQFVNVNAYTNGKGPGMNNQLGAYVAWNFFDKEAHTTPYMTGTYLGTKKVWNIAAGTSYQKSATWYLSPDTAGAYSDTSFADMLHIGIETFLDMPVDKEKGTALNAFAGYYITGYGHYYLRYNGLMNPANGSTAANLVQSSAYGNSFPMFGTGSVMYAQFGYLLPKKLLGENNGQLMPYGSFQLSKYEALDNKTCLLFDIGLNWLVKAHNAKLSLDYQNRPTFYKDTSGNAQAGARKNCVILQYQVFI